MDLRQLRYFCAIAARRSFRAAGEDLRIAQPALSQQMRRLEDELGVELFDRSTRPVGLTDAGEHLLPRARQLLADLERATAEVREFSGEFRGRIAVGAMQYLTNLELPGLLASFRERHPLVELGLRVGNTGQLCELLESGELDIAVCHSDELDLSPEFATEELRTEELVIVVAAADPLAGQTAVTVQELAPTPLITFRKGASIREALQHAFDEAGLVPQISFESADLPTAIELVRRGLGVALVPRSIAEREPPSVTALPIAPVRLTRRVALIWRSDRHRSRALEAFRRDARRTFTVPAGR